MTDLADKPDFEFFGIPVYIFASVPEKVAYLITRGKKVEIQVHEGPKAGQTVETWLEDYSVRRINL